MIRATLPLKPSEVADALEGLVRVNVRQMGARSFPPLYVAGIQYRKERGEDWQSAGRLLKSKAGDCEDLAAYRAAELRLAGDKGAHVIAYRSAPGVIHAIVEKGDGSWEDPSIRLGMKPPKPARSTTTGAAAPSPWASMFNPGLRQPQTPTPPTTTPTSPGGWAAMFNPGLRQPQMYQPAQQPMYFYPGQPQPMMMPMASPTMMPGGFNPYLALAQLQSGQPLGIQAQLAQLANGQFQATLRAPGLPPVQATASTPQAAGKGTFGQLAAMSADPAMQQMMGPYGPAVAAGAQVAAILAKDKQVQKAFKNAGKDMKKAMKSMGRSKPVKALAKLFGIK